MNESFDYFDELALVTQARRGDQSSLETLAQLAQERLFAYIYRLTLDYDTTQDLLQETLLQMVESISNLAKVEKFWAWLFRTAFGKVQHYYRGQQQKRKVQSSAQEKQRLLSTVSSQKREVLDKIIQEEISDAVFGAMGRLKLSHRNIIILRCFEQMPYSEIAELLSCKELYARVLFCRAKNSLRHQLSKRGFSKAMLLTALGVFGLITAPAKGASTAGAVVTATSLEVGSAAGLLGFMCTNLGMTLTAVAAGLTVTFMVKAFLWFIVLVLLAFFCVCVDLCSR